jgi:hypothetical protein
MQKNLLCVPCTNPFLSAYKALSALFADKEQPSREQMHKQGTGENGAAT